MMAPPLRTDPHAAQILKNEHEQRVREFIASLDLTRATLREVVRRVVHSEFGELMAADHMIPKDLPDRYSSLVFEDNHASAYLLQWPEGKAGTEIHDHGESAGAVIVLRGLVKETKYAKDGKPSVRDLRPGQVISFGPASGYIHKFEDASVTNEALSLHFYEPPLVRMNYYSYDKEGVFVVCGHWKECDRCHIQHPPRRVER